MLIIFDLDDTLIDTSGSVTPFKMEQCLQRLVTAGLQVGDFKASYEELLAINARSSRSNEAITEFVSRKGGKPSWIEMAAEEMTAPLPEGFIVLTTPGAKDTLNVLRSSHTLALVTGGRPCFQSEKLEKAGIDRSFFSNIAIPEDSVKKPFYEGLQRKFSLPPDQILVCGDRIAMDLQPAHELGFMTVHMRWGRGKLTPTPSWIHYAIEDLRELTRIVKV